MTKKRNSNTKCCITSCKNAYRNTSKEIRFYTFPLAKYKAAQCLEWKRWVRNTNATPNWEPTKASRICSSHFVGNSSSTIMTSPSYVPSIFKRKELHMCQVEKSALQRFNRFMKRRMHNTEHMSGANEGSEKDNILLNVSEVSFAKNNFSSNHQNKLSLMLPSQLDKGIQVEIFDIKSNNSLNRSVMFVCTQYVCNGVCEAQTQVFIPQKRVFSECATKFITTDKCCSRRIVHVKKDVGSDNPDSVDCNEGFYEISGVKNYQEILDLAGVSLATFKVLLKALSDIQARKMSNENRLMIFLIKMKTGSTFSAIGCLFRIHRTTAFRTFRSVLQTLRDAFNHMIAWPCRKVVQKSMPEEFVKTYQDCRIIIDCTEIKLEQPSTIENCIFTYSQHKKAFTTKILVGYTPGGLISFISLCYGGRTSDSQVTVDSGILDLLEPGDVVLADKSFSGVKTVLDETGKGTFVLMPPFLDNGYFSAEEVRIARVRKHIERITQKLRVLKILDKFTSDIFPLADSIVFMSAVLVNLQPPIIKNVDIDDT